MNEIQKEMRKHRKYAMIWLIIEYALMMICIYSAFYHILPTVLLVVLFLGMVLCGCMFTMNIFKIVQLKQQNRYN